MYHLHTPHLYLPYRRWRRLLGGQSRHHSVSTQVSQYLVHFRRVAFNTRRWLAMIGILLAVSLEFCGCNTVRDCALVRQTQIASLPWSELLQECSQCLTAAEVATLEDRGQSEAERSAGLGLADGFVGTRTVEQTLRGDSDLSFDNPAPLDDGAMEPRRLARRRLAGAVGAPGDAHPVPWAIPESVFFVYHSLPREDGPAQRTPAATAFVVSVPEEHGGMVRFLVTARHVVDPQWARCTERDPASINVRFNRRSGGVGYETIPLQSGGARRFFTPTDPAADLAIVPLEQALGPRMEEYKFIDTPFGMLPNTAEGESFRPGLPVVTARLSQDRSDEPDSYPIFDAGTLAAMPATSVEVQCGRPGALGGDPQRRAKSLHVWFIDAGVPRGVSGAPVYTALARGEGGSGVPVLLGVQSVTWPERGVAGITPSAVLAELIQSALRRHDVGMNLRRGPEPKQQETRASLY
jgi:hypothetical protein